ncbi:MAG TPA: response regulator transcription factor [Bryobacteraceae bacterium]|nr:response regulator transcription factor [Bryobacteraceae bacterium]
MIRVLIHSQSSQLENAIRSGSALEFAGRIDLESDLAGDVLLVDSEALPDSDWQSFAELPIPVVLLLATPDPGLAASALRAGIRGAIPRDATPSEIEAAVQAVNAGLVVSSPEFLRDSETADLLDPLSDRELEVLDLVAEGLSNKLIAHRLNISEHTVKTHVASIFAKLGASSRTEAVSLAIRRGFVML